MPDNSAGAGSNISAGVPPLSIIDVQIDSSGLAVRQALGLILADLVPLALDVEEVSTIELVLAEVMNNIVEHAYPNAKSNSTIQIQTSQKANGLHFTIIDHGNSMPDGHAPLGTAQNINVDMRDMPEGGFGWFLINDLAKDVKYQRIGHENRLDLRIAVAIPTGQ